jgi:hypothetical protein
MDNRSRGAGVKNRKRIWNLHARFMMVANDEINAERLAILNRFNSGDAAIDRDDTLTPC